MNWLILADDFTGAMDTGCQFAGTGLDTWVLTQARIQDLPSADVLVVNTQSRNMTPSEAYQITQELLSSLGDRYDGIYIKTDSAFRGNLSAVLCAAVDTIGVPMHFVPSYPQVDRTLAGGIVYIGENLLEYSVFAQDPRNPMRISKAMDILRMDYPLRCSLVRERRGYQEVPDTQVYLYDCTSTVSIQRIAEELVKEDRTRLIGGCAGLAGALAPYMKKEGTREEPEIESKGGALIVSGSANRVTFAQLARRNSTHVVNLAREEIRMESYVESLKNGENLIIAAACTGEDVWVDAPEEYHRQLAEKIAGSTRELLEKSGTRKLAVFGGETVQAILNELHCYQVEVLGDLEEGVPVCQAFTDLGTMRLVTKSGGLGSEMVIPHIMGYFGGGR